MPAPSNISFLTATDLGTLPASATQTVDFAGTTYTVYYSFTAPTGAVEIGAFAFGDLAVYKPILEPFNGPAAAPVAINSGAIVPENVPCQFPVIAGQTYFLQITPSALNPSPAVLTLTVQAHATVGIPVGSLAVNDDTFGDPDGFPLVLLSGTADYQVLRFVNPFPSGEGGDTLINGTVAVEDIDTNGVTLFNSSYQQIATHVSLGTRVWVRTCTESQRFYLGVNTNPTRFYTLDPDGTLGAAHIMAAMTSIGSGAASNDESIYYHAFTGTNVAVRTWNIAGAAAGANLLAGVAGYSVNDLLVLADDTILVAYYKTTVTRDQYVLHVDATGSVLHTYTLPVPLGSSAPRLASAIDDPISFWVFTHPASTPGIQQLFNIKISDGSVLTTRNHAQFESGSWTGTPTATPPATYGASGSCPFWVTRSAIPTTTTFTIRRQRRWLLPQSDSNKRMTIPTLELLMRTGIGLLPDAAGSSTPLGVDPEVRLRISKDGGKTWGPERARSAGLRGEFTDRVRWTRATGNYRNGVGEITVDAPVDWQWLAVMGDPTEGSS